MISPSDDGTSAAVASHFHRFSHRRNRATKQGGELNPELRCQINSGPLSNGVIPTRSDRRLRFIHSKKILSKLNEQQYGMRFSPD